VLDLSTALPRFGNDRSFFLEMCQDFIEQIPTRLQEMKISFYAGDANRLSSHAHNLKGVAANFSAGPISRIAKEIEDDAKLDDLTRILHLLEEIEAETKRLRRAYIEIESGNR
jgi:two-component system sensor histidine kinase/response regulator